MKEKSQVSKKSGLPPGTLVHIGKKRANKVKISVIDYTETSFHEFECEAIEDVFAYKEKDSVSWINIDGIHNTNIIDIVGSNFGHHPLLLEDIVNTLSRPKLEEFDDYLFITLKMLGISENQKSIVEEQVSFILGKNYVISFQEQPGDIFDSIRMRIKESKGNIRKRKTDYLFYRLLDTVVDHYFFIVEHLSERIEQLEDIVLKTQTPEILHEIQDLKTELIQLRKSISPLREAVGTIQKDEIKLIHKNTLHYFNDVNQNLLQVAESIDIYREMTKNLMDLYQSGINNKMNQVMQILTVIATIFIPLTFIVGIYGMNFEYMPELKWRYGYFTTWGIMVLIVLLMLRFFKRKNWF
ncbi:MAG: magnesium/cobalt transporter CorA [Bacteroidetes bacterium]|jgi:magnesium transporter|nr:magnesium/cobalt transporter CorA [Bacteroidota bacterium]